jgi:hypothetical protein
MTVLFASILNSAIANAADQVCDVATLDAVAKHLKLKDFYLHDFETNAGIVVSAACKAALQVKNIELAAIAYYSPDNNPSQNQ